MNDMSPSSGTAGQDVTGPATDLVLVNGRFFTLNPAQPWAEAVVVGNGRIIFVGSESEARRLAASDAEIVGLGGRLATPSFVDAHLHPVTGALRYWAQLNLFRVHSDNMKEAYLQTAEAYIREHPELPWIQGAGFRRAAFDELGPRKEWLDQLESRRPVSLISKDGHSMWVNTRALEAAGITSETPDPPNGLIQRDPEGHPTGLLQEAAMHLVTPHIPKPSREVVKKALLRLDEWLNAKGITTAHDAILELNDPEVYEAYRSLAEEGRLTVRYRASWRLDPDRDVMADIDKGLALSKGFTSPHFQVRSFKFFADEVVEEETAYLLQPYLHRKDGFHGQKNWKDDELRAAFAKIHRAGGQVHIHAIGDGASRYTIDALAAVQKETGITGRRPNLAHLQMIASEDIQRMAELGIVALVSPYWAVIDDYFWELFIPYLGRERCFEYQHPLKSFFDAGVVTAIHSDFSVTEPNIARAMYSSLTRRLPRWYFDGVFSRRPGYRYAPEKTGGFEYGEIGALPPTTERIGLEEALRAGTINGAYANFLEEDIGSIQPGKLADMVVWDRDLFKIDVEEIAEAQVHMTFFEGRPVWQGESNVRPVADPQG